MPPDFSDVITGDCYKVISVGAEAGADHPASMLDGSFFLPLPVNNPPDFSGVITRDCYKVISVGTEAGPVHPVSMLDDVFFLPLPVNNPQILAVLSSEAVTR